METIGRVFLAVAPPAEIQFAMAEHLADLNIPGRLAPPENWHVTLRFLDVVDRVTYERFLSGMDQPVETSFKISLDGFGAFANPRKATVVWIGIGEGSVSLGALNEQAEEAAVSAGLTPEERPFHPHLTLSRVRPPADVRHLLTEELSFSWRCQSLVAFRSHVSRGGATYEPLDTIDLIG